MSRKYIRVTSKHPYKRVNVLQIDNHTVNSIPVATAGSVVNSKVAPIIEIMHHHACIVKGKCVHNSVQIDHLKSTVDEKSIKEGGEQHVVTNNDCVIPSCAKNGLP